MENKQPFRLTYKSLLIFALGIFSLYFAGLGSYPLVDPDESIYGQFMKEMVAGGDWLTPHYNHALWFDKPPLLYWLMSSCASILGPTELACRLPSAILAVGIVLLVYALASYDFGKRTGLFSAVVMATCLHQIVLARAGVTDITLVFCTTSALYAYRRWLDGGWKWAALCGLMTGLGIVTKGPMVPFVLMLTILIHLWWTGRIKRILSRDVLIAVALALIVGLPWYLAMYKLHGDAFVQGFIVANNLDRYTKPLHASQTGGWYSYLLNIPILFVFFFPWSMLFPKALGKSWRANDGAKLAFVWSAVVFVFISLSKTILVTYIFPIYPAISIFVGVMLSSAASRDSRENRPIRIGMWFVFGVSVLIAAGLIVCTRSKYPDAMQAATILGAILIIASAISLLLTYKSSVPSGVWAMAAGMIVFTLWLIFGVVPHVRTSISTEELVKQTLSKSSARIMQYSIWRPSILFYLGRKLEDARDAEHAKQALIGKSPVIVICKPNDAPAVAPPNTAPWKHYGNIVVFANESAILSTHRTHHCK